MEKRRVVSEKEWQRRYGGKKHRRNPPKRMTPTQAVKSLCELHALSQRGNTEQLIYRILKYFALIISEWRKKGAPKCFGAGELGEVCHECVLYPECVDLFKDLKKVGRERRRYRLRKKLKRSRLCQNN